MFLLVNVPTVIGASPVNPEIDQDEISLLQLSKEESESLEKSSLLYKEDELDEYLESVLRKIVPPNSGRSLEFSIRVIKDPFMNAFIYPDGKMYVHSGLLARMEDEAQLATLIGHEITHATNKHALTAYKKSLSTGFVDTMKVMFGADEMYANGIAGLLIQSAGKLLAEIGDLGSQLSLYGYSRSQEREADANGFRLMKEAGYDPSESPKLFRHMQTQLREEKVEEPFYFASHPKLQERIESYEELVRNYWQDKKNGVVGSDIYRHKTKKVLLVNAGLQIQLGRYSSALVDLEKCISIDMNNAKAYYLRGEIFRFQQSPEAAKTNYEKAISLDASMPEPYKQLGIMAYKQRDYCNAKLFLEKYLSLDPNATDKSYIREYIKACI